MDVQEAWLTKAVATKAPAVLAARTNTLDSLSPAFAPFAARWDAETKRRHELRTPENLKKLMDAQKAHTSARSTAATAKAQRTAAKAASKNPLSTARRSAATADKAARTHQKSARAKLKTAKASYPATLRARAVQAHAVHAVPGAVSSWLMSTAEHWVIWPGTVSAGLIALNAGALWLGRRTMTVAVDDALSAEERRLASRLDPSYWVQHADERGLSGTVPTPVEVTPAGLVTHVRLDAKWTPAGLKGKAAEIRALLGARTDLRMEIKAGSHGDRATITLRTRNAAEDADLSGWAPGDPWGVDTVTGEPVHVPLGRRVMVAGTSGAGKSWSTRALLAAASESEDHRLVVIDPKRVEAINWEHRARTAITPEDVLDVTDELYTEMVEREQLIPRGEDVIKISARRPRITVFVDEGAEVIAMSKKERARGTKEEPGDPDWGRIIENLRSIARRARAAEIILVWATQKPTMSGEGHGIDSQIAGQITYRASLALASASESQVVFGQDAHEKGWHAHELPMPGYALLRSHPKAKPHHIRTRAMSPQDVIALPARPVWSRAAGAPAAQPKVERPALQLVKDEAAVEVPAARPAAEPVTNRTRVLDAVRDGARTNRDIVDATGINKGSVSKLLKALVADGELAKLDDGQVVVAVKGVSA
ncbi:FtsK/SpoIIIE domain-containing protein [Streptomyces sp. NE06-03E]|uniref:FtsK/SpoIIIE domain-containing protein n=1 Tax=Streptomyces sp. NE06-03E TaxID=3028695 RepID=UPI0029A41392|nr:FtsK/SpoIIIE domain-containing protein [Streptomyces sp. NE06-03E]MDX3059605.1 FtsK/SpoIIIE domain-containing protein [Streptomyces sp. NE06-03E]MDX3059610.1 FtsK/SpoIIIE domain-containing protein [Streptomyces sp. NE06-03E]